MKVLLIIAKEFKRQAYSSYIGCLAFVIASA